MEEKGTPTPVLERLQIDRIGFVDASVKIPLRASDLGAWMPSNGNINTPQAFKSVYGSIVTRMTAETENGVTMLRWLYEGLGSWLNGKSVTLYEWQGQMESVPIQTHPNFPAWLNKNGYLDEMGNWIPFATVTAGTTQATLFPNAAGSQIRNPLLGSESFLSMGATLLKRFSSVMIPPGLLQGVGLIVEQGEITAGDNYLGGTNPLQALNIPSGRNFLKGTPSMTWRGNAWDITCPYMMSGAGGISKLIYDPTTWTAPGATQFQ